MEPQDREPIDLPQLEHLWPRMALVFAMLSVGMLVNLIFHPHILTVGAMFCFAAATVASFRAWVRSMEYDGKPLPREHMRPRPAQFRRLGLILGLVVGGILLCILRDYLHG